ncbi:MAG: hypothetical protein ACO1OB_06650 [Archangium sp.]
MPIFFLVRHAVELALKDLVRFAWEAKREALAVEAYEREGTAAAKKWFNIATTPELRARIESNEPVDERGDLMAECARKYAAAGTAAAVAVINADAMPKSIDEPLNRKHALKPLIQCLADLQIDHPSAWNDLIERIDAFEKGQDARSRFETVGKLRAPSLPRWGDPPLALDLQPLIEGMETFIREAVDMDCEPNSVLKEICYDNFSDSTFLSETEVHGVAALERERTETTTPRAP